MKNPIFALVDCNNFYVSCERVFHAQYHKVPVVVLSNNDGNVIARSEEAKAIGIKMAAPIKDISHLMKQGKVKVFSSNYALYGDMSRRVKNTLAQFTPLIENYSIDESFLILNGFERRDLTEYGKLIKETVKQNTGIPVSIGIGPTKTLAKVANKLAKRNPSQGGVFNLYGRDDIDEYLKQIQVEDVWGVGFQHSAFFHKTRFDTAWHLKYAPDGFIRKRMTVTGLRTVWELRGIPCIPLEEERPPRKEIVSSRSFGRPVESLKEMEEALALYVNIAVEKLRKQNSHATILAVFVGTNPFRPKDPQYSNSISIRLPIPTSDISILLKWAHELLPQIYKPGYRYKKTGILLSGLVHENQITMDMFLQEKEKEKTNGLWDAIQKINGKYGRNTIHTSSSGIERPWLTRANYKSQRFTTQWDEALEVRA